MTCIPKPRASLAALAALLVAAPAQEVRVLDRAYGQAGAAGELAGRLLELRWAAPAGALELRGGRPGTPAVIVLGERAADAPTPLGTVCVAGGVPHFARFDDDGACLLPVDVATAGARWFAQGFDLGAAGTPARASNGLELQVVAVPAAPAPAAGELDASLLRFDFGGNRSDEVEAALARRDLDSAIVLALDSPGDELGVELSGKIGVPIAPGVSVGGKVALRAALSRTEECFEIAIEREVAVTLGVEATKDIGVNGGYGAAFSQVYEFATAGEAARGLLQIAAIQALGVSAAAANENALAALRRARAALAAARAARDAFVRSCGDRWLGPRVRAALEAALTLRQRIVAARSRGVEAAVRAYAWVVEARASVRDHRAGVQVQLEAVSEISLEVDGRALGKIGGAFKGERTIAVRVHRCGDAPVDAVIARVFQQSALELSAARAGELAATRKVEVGSRFERGADGFRLAAGPTLTVSRDIALLSRKVGGAGKVGAGVELQLEVDLAAAGTQVLEAFLAGDAAPLADLAAVLSVQGRGIAKVGGETGFGAAGGKVELGVELGFKDCGRKHAVELCAGDLLTRLPELAGQATAALAAAN